MFRRLVAATELVELCAAPVLAALKIAAQSNARLSTLHVLESDTIRRRHVVKDFQSGESIAASTAYKATVKKEISKRCADLLNSDVSYKIIVVAGFPWKEILRLARKEKSGKWYVASAVERVSSLSLIVSPHMESESILSVGEKEYSEIKSRLREIGRQAAKRDAEVDFHIVSLRQQKFSCSENTPHAVVVGSDGSISPCVMKQLPVIGRNFYYYKNQKHQLQNLDFGNIFNQSFSSIWRQKDFQQFILDELVKSQNSQILTP